MDSPYFYDMKDVFSVILLPTLQMAEDGRETYGSRTRVQHKCNLNTVFEWKIFLYLSFHGNVQTRSCKGQMKEQHGF